MNEIITIADSTFDVGHIQTMEDIKAFIIKLETLEKLLKATERWHENICKFCALEAQAYCRIAEIGGEDFAGRNSQKRKVVLWLQSLSQEDREKCVQECFDDGISIIALYKREVIAPQKREDAIESLEYIEEKILDDFEANGIIEINSYEYYIDDIRKELGSSIVTDKIDGIRKKIRDKGGLGIEDGKGTYVRKELASGYFKEIVDTRVRGIANDLSKLWQLANEMEKEDIQVEEYGLIEKEYSASDRLSKESAINVMLSIMGLRKVIIKGQKPIAELRTIDALLQGVGSSIGNIFDLFRDAIRETPMENPFYCFSAEGAFIKKYHEYMNAAFRVMDKEEGEK